jgi:predicted aspartyl protease
MRFAVRGLALAAAFASIAAAPPPDPLAAIAEASGHPAALHFRATGTHVDEGRKIVTTFDQLGGTKLIRRCVAAVCGGTWFDGSRRWTFGLNEVPLPEDVDAATLTERTLAAIESYAFAEPAFRASGGTAVRGADGRWRVRARDGAELLVTIDPAGRTVRRVELPDGSPVAVYGREARAGGAVFPLDRDGPFEPGRLDGVVVVREPVSPPAGAAVTVAGEGALRLGAEPIPIVPCTLGGKNARCLLDTGATPSAVTLNLAEALNLEPQGELEISGLARFATGFVEAGPLALGPARFERARFAVIPPSGAARFDVVVGSDLMARLRLVFDRKQGTVRVLAGGSGPAPAGAARLTFRSGSPLVQTTVGTQGVPALLDTGDQAVLSFGYGAYRQGPQWPVVSRGQAVGIGSGSEDAFVVEVPEVQVGPLALGKTRAVVRRTQTIAHVGIGMWDRYVLDLDEAAGRVVFSPR